jgi:hypothetical protein
MIKNVLHLLDAPTLVVPSPRRHRRQQASLFTCSDVRQPHVARHVGGAGAELLEIVDDEAEPVGLAEDRDVADDAPVKRTVLDWLIN